MSSARQREKIEECIVELQSDGVDLQLKALQALASITKVSPHSRNLIAEAENVVAALLTLTRSPIATIQSLSLSVLFNLSLNPELKHPMAEMETIHHLNLLLITPTAITTSPEAIKLACCFICSLAMLNKNKAKFGVAGTVQVLVKAISGTRGPATHHLLSCLAELVEFHGNCTLAVGADAVKVLMGIVESKDGEDVALAILGLLARFEEGLSALITSKEVVRVLVEALKSGSTMSKEGSAEILVRILDESDECLRDAFEVPELLSLLADMSVRGSTKGREKAGQLMMKMTEAAKYAPSSYAEETSAFQ